MPFSCCEQGTPGLCSQWQGTGRLILGKQGNQTGQGHPSVGHFKIWKRLHSLAVLRNFFPGKCAFRLARLFASPNLSVETKALGSVCITSVRFHYCLLARCCTEPIKEMHSYGGLGHQLGRIEPSPHFLVLPTGNVTAVLNMWNRSASACSRRSGECRGSH